MKDILIGIDKLAEEELEKANKVNPLFHSDHEGYAVLKEEIDEANDEFTHIIGIKEKMSGKLDELWKSIKEDNSQSAAHDVMVIKHCAGLAAAELIQVVAMCDKFITSQELRESEGK